MAKASDLIREIACNFVREDELVKALSHFLGYLVETLSHFLGYNVKCFPAMFAAVFI